MTGYDEKETKDRAAKVTPLAYMIKPVQVDKIASIFSAYLEDKM